MDSKILKTRNEIEEKYKWKISDIYADDDAWEKDFILLKSLIPSLSKYKNNLSNGEKLLSFFKDDEKIGRLHAKLYMYATFKHHGNTGESTYQSMYNKIEMCSTDFETLTSFFIPEIITIGIDTISILLEEHPELDMYKKHLDFILACEPHMLSEETEAVIAQISDAFASPDAVYSALCDSDMTFPKIKDEDGTLINLTDSNYSSFIRSQNRSVREEAFKAMFNTLGSFKNTFGTNLLSNIKNLSNIAKIRRYNSSIECAVDGDNIPVSVYNMTVDTINNNLDSLHRYIDLKKKLLGYDELHMYDLYASVFEKPEEIYSFETGVKIVKDALAILGEEYIQIASEGLDNGWCDVYPNKGKKGGAYSWGSYDTKPYFLLNYVNELNDVFTLAHELGHSMHSLYSNRTQPYIYSGYTIFNAEVASTTNEILLMNYLIHNCTDKKMKRYLITHELEQIRNTLFRQAMFAEFEKIMHEKIDNSEGLSTDDICDIYYDLNVKYFGNNMFVDNEIRMEWTRIPHFYSNFYVYKYVTGYAAATMFATSILNNEEGALEKYKKFLCLGSSDYSIEIQKSCGVDMTTSAPMEAALSRFNYLLNLLEEIV